MENYDDNSVAIIRMSAFFGVFFIMAILERIFERRKRLIRWQKRWFTNLGIIIINSAMLYLIRPLGMVMASYYAYQMGWGLFNFLNLPLWFEILMAVIIFDFLIYLIHIAAHKIPMLWQFHRVHHADRDLDVTSGLRFHPIEILISMLYKIIWVFILGPSVLAVIIFEIILNGLAMFNHANFKISKGLDKYLRIIIVTPDFHRVHHSDEQFETDSNYGFNISLWDRVFRTYIPNPNKGHSKMVLGLKEVDGKNSSDLLWCLTAPFK